MSTVNPDCRLPSIPREMWWLDEEHCLGCGDDYKRWHPHALSFSEAVHELRAAAKGEGDDGGGFRSRGPVLWRMRCAKMQAWILEHYHCEPF